MATQMFKERVKAVLKNKDLQLAHKRTDQDVVQPSIIRSNETRTTWARICQTVSDLFQIQQTLAPESGKPKQLSWVSP